MLAKKFFSLAAAALLVHALAGGTRAAFHLWQIVEVYSDPSGTVQFVEMFVTASTERFVNQQKLTSQATGKSVTIMADLPIGSTANKSLLFASPGYVALPAGERPTPDFVFPSNNFFNLNDDLLTFTGGNTLDFGPGQLPVDGLASLNRAFGAPPTQFTQQNNTPRNYGGGQMTVDLTPGWKVDASGTWSNSANWTGGVPNAVGATANFGGKITAPRTVTVDAPQTVGTIKFDNANAYTVAGPAAITLSNGGNATINVASGNHTISAPLTLAAGNSLTKSGAGGLTLSGPFASSPTSTFTVAAGTLNLNTDAGTNLSLAANATTNLGVSQHLAGLSIADGVGVQMAAGGKVLRTSNLSIGAGSSLDLADGKIILDVEPDLRMLKLLQTILFIRSGAAGLSWTGPGIRSSTAASDATLITGIGVMLNDNGLGGPYRTQFGGETVDQNNVLVRYTYYGDADLSGAVDGTDYALTDNGFNSGGVGWFNGDFDYSGAIDGTDYALIDNAFNGQGGPLVATVPEPPGGGLMLAAALCLLLIGSRRAACAAAQVRPCPAPESVSR